MKTLTLSLILAACSFAQTAITITIQIDAAKNPQVITLPAALVQSLVAFSATQIIPDPTDAKKTVPKYADLAVLILANLKNGLFSAVVASSPPAAVIAKKTIVDAAQADYEATKKATLP